MAVGTKVSTVQTDESGVDFDEHFFTLTDLGLARVPRSSIRGLDGRIQFVVATSTPSLVLTDADHYRRFININNSAGAVDVVIPILDDAIPDIDDLSFGGLYAEFVITSGAFDVSFSVSEAGDLRGTGNSSELVSADTIYVGLNRSLADEAIVRLYKRGGLWIADCTQGWRDTADGDALRPIDISAATNRQITDADHARPIWLTAASPGTMTFQSDIAVGTQTTIINQGSNAAGFDFGTHTQVGDSTIPVGQAASLIVGPTTTGTNREIFVAAST